MNHSPRIRLPEGPKGGLLSLLVISAVWVSRDSRLSATDSTEHPYVDAEDLKPATCLKCHPTKNQGNFVHTAMAMGCDKCHRSASVNNTTTIKLSATGGDLCGKCHEVNKDPMLHGPYGHGQCLICHDPHPRRWNIAQTRASVNMLCLVATCGISPAPVVNTATKVVSLLDERAYNLASWEQAAPKISPALLPGQAGLVRLNDSDDQKGRGA